MVRVSHTAGGASSIVFGTEEPKTTPTKAPAPEPIAEAPAAEPAAPAAEEPAPATATPAAATETLDGLKLKLLNVANNLSKAGSEEAAAVAALIKALETSGALEGPKSFNADTSIALLKAALKARGTHGIVSLGRKFKSMDDDHNNKLSFEEFHKALVEMKIPESDVHRLFRYFDSDCSGYLSFQELLVGLRGQLNTRRSDMVARAFKVLDKTGDGKVTLDDLKGRYDAKHHPDVLLGTKTSDEVLTEFMGVFEAEGGGVKGDGVVTQEEFSKYYSSVSASVDDDDYFELVIRNAWHISGGEGWSANTTCKRVLVLHADGSQTVQEIKDDFDIKPEQYKEKLAAQGVTDVKSIAVYGNPDDVPSAKAAETAPPPSPTLSPFRRNVQAGQRSSIIFG